MNTTARKFWQTLTGQEETEVKENNKLQFEPTQRGEIRPLDIPSNDPLLAYFISSPGVVEVDKLNLDSPTLLQLKEAGVRITVPLVSQGELIGLLNLGPRMSEQEYSSDDRRLLDNLATQAAPALRVAQLVRQQQAEARERERIEQELRVARVIQQTLLPRDLPSLEGWHVAAHWQPARAVGGDFYDFVNLPEGRLGIIIADVTDKGVPAAMVMATTRSILRGAAERLVSPGKVLQRANDLLYPDIPPNMFVTCLYALLDPQSGEICLANAGHNLPYRQSKAGVEEIRATGMPLGLMKGMDYEEKLITLAPGECLLLSSDGLVEAHDPNGEMLGFPRVKELLSQHPGGAGLIEFLMERFNDFTGADYDQEDDITLVILEHSSLPSTGKQTAENSWITLAEFSLPSQQGNERQAVQQIADLADKLSLPPSHLERLKTAVAEATMNAMEHGNRYDPDLPVEISVRRSQQAVAVEILDYGGGENIPDSTNPDISAKLEGEQSPRGWGLFLIKNMVDEMIVNSKENEHTVQLIMKLKGEKDG